MQKQFLERLRASEIGDLSLFTTPFGERRLVYADYVASGRSVDFVEDTIAQKILPVYANTHTDTSHCGQQMGKWRLEARQYIASQVNAQPTNDVVLFTGSGCTGAIHLLIGRLQRLYNLQHAVVFIGPYEHHSNDLSWRETGAKIVRIRPGNNGGIDLQQLKNSLRRYRRRALLIGTFSVASNITGITTDTVPVTKLLKSYGALALWDYAAGAPYMKIDMHEGGVAKDAIFFSMHKFMGGPGTPGVLVAARSLFSTSKEATDSEDTLSSGDGEVSDCVLKKSTSTKSLVVQSVRKTIAAKSSKMNDVPVAPGGGTVFLVSRRTHQYVDDIEEREEGGTPDIVGSIRAAMVFQLKDCISVDFPQEKEYNTAQHVMAALTKHENIVILGDPSAPRLPTFSFLIRHGTLFLHPQFVSRLLSDLFGIQTRSGCACAGPYGALLFQMPDELAQVIFSLMQRKALFIKPGFTRLNFPVFWSKEREQFVIDAIHFVAEHGWRFLPLYDQCLATGTFTYRTKIGAESSLKSLETIMSDMVKGVAFENSSTGYINELDEYNRVKNEALNYVTNLMQYPNNAYGHLKTTGMVDPIKVLKTIAKSSDENLRHFCWFLTSYDVVHCVLSNKTIDRCSVLRPLFCEAIVNWPPPVTLNELKALRKIAFMEADKVHSIHGTRLMQKLMGFK
ncbi:hypothetical protein THRCLA_05967 [Thraustotheca clavata]|uniref:Aminotransferase class V domain-containing protein n=1 Tax=Thraustotheca clavata TaxID=74557 RepID=A0A1V9ZQX7_9STRA|nr:hypothetical protein THRCLA_05967 [Thraustotheca clavata]